MALTIVLVVAGIQGWRVVTAIMHMEQAAVVPLPPSEYYLDDLGAHPAEAPSTAGLVADTGSTYGLPVNGDVIGHRDVTAGQDDEAIVRTQASAGDSSAPPDPPSRLEVAQALVEAGMANGDPGRSSVWEGRTTLNVLVLGVDRRADGGDQNADVIVLARLDLIGHTLSGVSIPRDLLVDVPGVGEGKINGSYNAGVLEAPDNPVAGVAKVRDTIETAFGVPVDGYILVDFSGFEDIVDALGGIDIIVPYEIVDTDYPTEDYGTEVVTFKAGLQHMDGEQALKYVRTRHADSDDARRQRQIDVIKAILGQGKSLSSITKADELIVTAGDAIQTSFTLEEQLTLARLAMEMSPDQVSIVTLEEPLLASGWTEEGLWIYTADPDALRSFIQEALGS